MVDTAPIYNSKGELVAVIETIQDITDRKIAEEELQKAKEAAERFKDFFSQQDWKKLI